MQTLYTIENTETGGIQTLLHVSSYTTAGLAVVIYTSDEYGTHKSTVRRTFMNKKDSVYHEELRRNIKMLGGIIHTRISDTPLQKSKEIVREDNRDSKGRFIKSNKK